MMYLLNTAHDEGIVDWSDYSTHKTLTCINHTDLRWSTKNPWDRSIFFTDWSANECDCPFSDLRVLI